MKVLIVDDEPKGQQAIQTILSQGFNFIEIVGMASNIDEAYGLILTQKPDLVFLDIEMPGGTGFDLLERFEQINFEIVFVTGFNHYAINAINFNCLHYISKPVVGSKIGEAIERYIKRTDHRNIDKRIDNLKLNLKEKKASKIVIPTKTGYNFVNLDSILFLEAEGTYTKIELSNGKSIFSSRILSHYDKLLDASQFFRVHRTFIVNTNYMSKFYNGNAPYLELINKKVIPISRRRKNEFTEYLKSLS